VSAALPGSGGVSRSPRGPDQDLRGDPEPRVKHANHVERERAPSLHDFKYAAAAADHADERASILAFLLEAEANGLYGVGKVDGLLPSLVGVYERDQHFEPIAFRRAFHRPPEPLDVA